MGAMYRAVVSVFLIVHITMMFVSGLPDRSALGKKILESISWYQIFFGLDQTWSMFAPNPSAENSYLDAVISFKDGSTEKWTFPRSSMLDDWERFTTGERIRKYQQENLKPMQRTDLWRDLSHFLEREVKKIEVQGRGRQISFIQFQKHFSVVKPPQERFVEHGRPTTDYQVENVFIYKPEDEVKYEAKNNH